MSCPATDRDVPLLEPSVPLIDDESRDATIDRSPMYEFACMLLYSLGMSVYSFQIAALGPTLPNLARNVNHEPTDPMFSTIFLVNGVLQIIAGPFSGLAIDMLNSHMVMAASILTQAVCLMLVPTARTLLTMVTYLGISFLCLNFLRTGIFTLACQINPRHTSSNLLILAVVFGITNFSAPKVADWFETHLWYDRLNVFTAWGVLAALVGVGLVCLKVPKLPAKKKTHKETAVQDSHEMGRRKASILAWDAWVIAGCGAVQFVSIAVEQGMGNWAYTYALEYGRLSSPDASTITSLYWGVFCGARILMAVIGFWIPITPATAILMFIPLGIAGTILPLSFETTSMYLLSISAMLIGIGNSTGFPNSIAMLATYSSPSGFANGIMGAVSGVGNSLIPALVSVGVTDTPFGWQWLFWMLTVLFALHFPVVWGTVHMGNKLIWLKDELSREEEAQALQQEADLEQASLGARTAAG